MSHYNDDCECPKACPLHRVNVKVAGCTCLGFGTAPCPVHLPEYTHRAIERAATKARANIDRLAQDREAIATSAINTLGELLLDRVPPLLRASLKMYLAELAPAAIQHVVLHAQSVQVVDERGPGSVVDLVDESLETIGRVD